MSHSWLAPPKQTLIYVCTICHLQDCSLGNQRTCLPLPFSILVSVLLLSPWNFYLWCIVASEETYLRIASPGLCIPIGSLVFREHGWPDAFLHKQLPWLGNSGIMVALLFMFTLWFVVDSHLRIWLADWTSIHTWSHINYLQIPGRFMVAVIELVYMLSMVTLIKKTVAMLTSFPFPPLLLSQSISAEKCSLALQHHRLARKLVSLPYLTVTCLS